MGRRGRPRSAARRTRGRRRRGSPRRSAAPARPRRAARTSRSRTSPARSCASRRSACRRSTRPLGLRAARYESRNASIDSNRSPGRFESARARTCSTTSTPRASWAREGKRRVLEELAVHPLLVEREDVRVGAREHEVEERGHRVLLSGGRSRRRRQPGEPRSGELGLEEEIDSAARHAVRSRRSGRRARSRSAEPDRLPPRGCCAGGRLRGGTPRRGGARRPRAPVRPDRAARRPCACRGAPPTPPGRRSPRTTPRRGTRGRRPLPRPSSFGLTSPESAASTAASWSKAAVRSRTADARATLSAA